LAKRSLEGAAALRMERVPATTDESLTEWN